MQKCFDRDVLRFKKIIANDICLLMPLDIEVAFWERLEYLAAAIVIIGAIGEAIADFCKYFKDRRNRKRKDLLSKWATIILIIGLAFEWISLVGTNHVFAIQETELRRTLGNRSISNSEKEALISILKHAKKGVVEVHDYDLLHNFEAAAFGQQVCEVLRQAGFIVNEVHDKDIGFSSGDPTYVQQHPLGFCFYGTNGTPVEFGTLELRTTNSQYVIYDDYTNPEIPTALYDAFRRIGFTSAFSITNSQNLRPNGWYLYVPVKF
jgi:hypothetical protein